MFKSLIKLITSQFSINKLSNPIKIYNLTNQIINYKFTHILNLTTILNIN
ncbi:hypothetical protein, partial [Klebsiella pneumoniae]